MTYTVQWPASVQQELADLWLNAVDRSAVTAAANAIDGALERDPLNEGESRYGRTRVLFVLPLGVYYEVYEASRL
jgi:hypothetical protein